MTIKWKELSSSPCNLCPRECRVNRKDGQMGYCLSDNRIFVARAALHEWEEPCISGEMGSGAVFFSGCNLRCVYCQNYEIASGKRGRQVSVSELAEIFLQLQAKGAANINLVTPDHYIDQIAAAVLKARDIGLTLPIVYNGSGYEKKEVIRNLEGIIDVFLTDFKYMDKDLAEKYSKASDYPSVAAAALEEMVQIAGDAVFDEKGMMQKGIIVRHLILPGHKKNAKEVIKYLYETYKDKIYISLMNQYTPFVKAVEGVYYKELCRKVTKREYEAVVDYAIELGVQNAFIQEGDTAKESFVPEFDLNFHV